MIDIRNAMNDIYKNLEPTLTKCGFRITTPADISDGIPVEVTSGRAVMDFSGENKALRIDMRQDRASYCCPEASVQSEEEPAH